MNYGHIKKIIPKLLQLQVGLPQQKIHIQCHGILTSSGLTPIILNVFIWSFQSGGYPEAVGNSIICKFVDLQFRKELSSQPQI